MFKRYIVTCASELIAINHYLLNEYNASEYIGCDELLEFSLVALYVNKCSVHQMLMHTDLADVLSDSQIADISEIIQDRIICSTIEIRSTLEPNEEIVSVKVKAGKDIVFQIEDTAALKEFIENHERDLEANDLIQD